MIEGWPAPYVSGVGLILAGISFIINNQAYIAGKLLAIELVIFVTALHIPGLLEAGMGQIMKVDPNILKDLAIASAALTIAGVSIVKIKYQFKGDQ